VAAGLARPAVDDRGARLFPSPDKNAGIGGVLQDAEDARINRTHPDNLPVAGLTGETRDQQLFIPVPEHDLAHTSQFTKLAEDAGNRFLYLAIGRLLDAFIFGTDITDWNLC
jgi:hypothetical protein